MHFSCTPARRLKGHICMRQGEAWAKVDPKPMLAVVLVVPLIGDSAWWGPAGSGPLAQQWAAVTLWATTLKHQATC